MLPRLVCISDYEEHARSVLQKSVYDYYKSGANYQETLADNIRAFSRWKLYPRMLRNVADIDLSTSVLGQRVSMPICVGATAMQCMAHVDGELATVRACQTMGTGMMLSSWATSSIEEVAEAGPEALRWMQLYIYKDREVSRQLVKRAEQTGYKAIFVTVDTPYLGNRFDDVRNRFKLPPQLRMKNFETNDLAFSPKRNYGDNSGLAEYVAQAIDPSLSWDDIKWLRRLTSLPIVVKGILRGDDAREAVKHGVDGILVSNHGARQLDGVPATIDALPEIVEAVEGKVEVFLDGGVRKGTDVLKALALGAKAVFVGRPIIWGLAFQGEKGVQDVLEILKEEFRLAMGLSGSLENKRYQGELNLQLALYLWLRGPALLHWWIYSEPSYLTFSFDKPISEVFVSKRTLMVARSDLFSPRAGPWSLGPSVPHSPHFYSYCLALNSGTLFDFPVQAKPVDSDSRMSLEFTHTAHSPPPFFGSPWSFVTSSPACAVTRVF
ncbi:Hydroxyacid oxidase 1 [Microtus ochrogaster]|uniref:(S)-2-hydroxy-acid oxidase n=1 Tax=Microtus ochrogaster TaxID=79684 RepID=A0A8J6GF97_MICOH|nr:Hydroxyacid oxidase 1 [Microtus ochrogaster]